MEKLPRHILLWNKMRRARPGSIKDLPVSYGVPQIGPGAPNYRQKIQMKYLGAGGHLIKRGEHAILTAPFFSNPSVARMLFWRIKCHSDQVDRFLSSLADELRNVRAILVGHAHYDHLMDVPRLAKKYAKRAKIYGNRTMAHILAPVIPSDRLVALDSDAATPHRPGKWHYTAGGRIRFMAIESKHAPQFVGMNFYKGGYTEDLKKLPSTASGWKEGQVLAFLIDFMDRDGRQAEFRIHYQDAASEPPYGFPPPFYEPENQRRVDVAIVCVAGFMEVGWHPEEIIRKLNPRFLILGHWENLFKPLPEDPQYLKVAPTVDAKEFAERLKRVLPADAHFEMPSPGAWMHFP